MEYFAHTALDILLHQKLIHDERQHSFTIIWWNQNTRREIFWTVIPWIPYLKGCHTEEGQDLFLILPECRTRNNVLKLQEARFRLDIRKNFLTVRAVRLKAYLTDGYPAASWRPPVWESPRPPWATGSIVVLLQQYYCWSSSICFSPILFCFVLLFSLLPWLDQPYIPGSFLCTQMPHRGSREQAGTIPPFSWDNP